jgi:hypothetical protein
MFLISLEMEEGIANLNETPDIYYVIMTTTTSEINNTSDSWGPRPILSCINQRPKELPALLDYSWKSSPRTKT